MTLIVRTLRRTGIFNAIGLVRLGPRLDKNSTVIQVGSETDRAIFLALRETIPPFFIRPFAAPPRSRWTSF